MTALFPLLMKEPNIKNGHVMAVMQSNTLHMVYHCLTSDNELKAGQAEATITIITNGKLRLDLDWTWLNQNQESGNSAYLEM